MKNQFNNRVTSTPNFKYALKRYHCTSPSTRLSTSGQCCRSVAAGPVV